MVLSAHVYVYISIFVFNKLTFCKNAVDNGTAGGMLGAAADETRTPWRGNQPFPSVTRDFSYDRPSYYSEDRPDRRDGTSCGGGVEKRSVGAAAVVANNVNATTARPKAKKTAATTVKTPQRANATRPAAKATGQPRNSTAWPKPDKRVAHEPPDGAKTAAANGTDDDDPVVTDFMNKYPIGMWKDHGFYTDDYTDLINRHWFKYAPPNQSSHYVLAVLYTVIAVFGCFGNSLVIFMYIKLVAKRYHFVADGI